MLHLLPQGTLAAGGIGWAGFPLEIHFETGPDAGCLAIGETNKPYADVTNNVECNVEPMPRQQRTS